MASVRDSLERLKAAVSAAHSQALERERLRALDAEHIRVALVAVEEAFSAPAGSEPPPVEPIDPPEPPPVEPPPVTLPEPSAGRMAFSSVTLEFSNVVVRWDGRERTQ